MSLHSSHAKGQGAYSSIDDVNENAPRPSASESSSLLDSAHQYGTMASTPKSSLPDTAPHEDIIQVAASSKASNNIPASDNGDVQISSGDRGGRVRQASRLAESTKHALRRIDPSLILDNTGSVARDHLAAERTFLAYVRTSLAFAGAGVALVQLFNLASTSGPKHQLARFAQPLGATVVLFGTFVLIVGTVRYFQIQTAMTRGKFPAARYTIAIQAVFLLALVVTIFSFLVNTR